MESYYGGTKQNKHKWYKNEQYEYTGSRYNYHTEPLFKQTNLRDSGSVGECFRLKLLIFIIIILFHFLLLDVRSLAVASQSRQSEK